MNLASRVDILLRLRELDYPSLCQKLSLDDEKLKEVLNQGDLTPSFTESLAKALGVEKEALLNEDSPAVPLGVYDFDVLGGFKKDSFTALFSFGSFLLSFGLGMMGFFMFLSTYQGNGQTSFLIGALGCIAIAACALVYPLTILFKISGDYKGKARVVLFANKLVFYKRREGSLVQPLSLPLNNITYVVENASLFVLKSYKHGLLFVPKGNMANDEVETIRSKLRKESTLYVVKGKVFFDQYGRMSTYERDKKDAFRGDLLFYGASFLGIGGLFGGSLYYFYFGVTKEVFSAIGFSLFVLGASSFLVGLYLSLVGKKEGNSIKIRIGQLYLVLGLGALVYALIWLFIFLAPTFGG